MKGAGVDDSGGSDALVALDVGMSVEQVVGFGFAEKLPHDGRAIAMGNGDALAGQLKFG